MYSKNNRSRSQQAPIEIYIDGKGCQPDKSGSGFAWIAPKIGWRNVQWEDGLTNNQAEYRALLDAVRALPDKSRALIFTDSQLVAEQWSGRWSIKHSDLLELWEEIVRELKRRSSGIEVLWIPRARNFADALLKQAHVTNSRPSHRSQGGATQSTLRTNRKAT
jgi:ribonuclease HI